MLPPPDAAQQADDLAPNADWSSALTPNGDGDQATFDIPSLVPGAQATFDITVPGTTRGLRVTIERGTHRIADESNGFRVTFAAGASSAVLTSASQLVELEFPDMSAMSLVKTTVDGRVGLNSVYFGGETGTSTIADFDALPDTVSAGGTPDTPHPTRGNRVTLARGTGRNGSEGNGYLVDFRHGTTAADVDDTNRIIAVTISAEETQADVKTAVDAETEISSSSYYGSGAATDLAWRGGLVRGYRSETERGTPDRASTYRVAVLGNAFLHIGTAEPANLNAVRVLPANTVEMGILPAGMRAFLYGVSADVRASFEVWR